MADLLPIPIALKTIKPFVKVGIEIGRRDPVVSYYCNFYAMQAALKTNYKAVPEAKGFLLKLMDRVEAQKSELKMDPNLSEAVSSDIAGQAVVEATAMKLFVSADSQDREGIFNKHVVKSFYTASILFDVLEIFDEPLSDEVKTHRKYARWKATYIHNCLKNNEQPIPGPVGGLENEDEIEGTSTYQDPSTSQKDVQNFPGNQPQAGIPNVSTQPKPTPRAMVPEPQASSSYENPSISPASSSNLSSQDFRDAEKLCKFAVSALQYEDVPSAIANLEKCLQLLRTGQ